MSYMNTTTYYGSISKCLHWLIFLAIAALLIIGAIMVQLPDSFPHKEAFFTVHKDTGLLVLTLMVIRILWAFINIKPPLPGTLRRWEAFAARLVHRVFYLILIAMPISGWIETTASGYIPEVFGVLLPFPGITKDQAVAEIAGKFHYVMAWIILGLIILHVGAALKHHFINKDSVLRTMLPKKWGGV